MKAIEMDFVLLKKRNESVISAPTGSAANKISGSTIYTIIRVNTRIGKTYKIKINA